MLLLHLSKNLNHSLLIRIKLNEYLNKTLLKHFNTKHLSFRSSKLTQNLSLILIILNNNSVKNLTLSHNNSMQKLTNSFLNQLLNRVAFKKKSILLFWKVSRVHLDLDIDLKQIVQKVVSVLSF